MENKNIFESMHFEQKKFVQRTVENYEFIECDFESCSFDECTAVGCRFIDCRFNNCNIISLRSKHTELKRTEFTGCNLIGIHWNELLPAGNVAEPLRALKDCYLKYNSFINMNLRKFDFSKNVILDSVFEDCSLLESDFRNSRLESTYITRCDIRQSDFREATGYQIDITTNRMKHAKFSFPEVINLLNILEIKID